jgi:hypothetical protein
MNPAKPLERDFSDGSKSVSYTTNAKVQNVTPHACTPIEIYIGLN